MLIHKSSKSLLLKLRPAKLAEVQGLLPHKIVNYEGHNIAVPHTLASAKILRNIGLKVPGPSRYYYRFPRPARFADVFEHQYATVDFLTINSRCFCLNEMGTSKTASACWAADYLMEMKEIQRVLIVAPLSTLEMVWRNELFDVCMHRTAVVLHGSAQKRRELFDKKVDFYIINPAGLEIIAGDLAKRNDIDLVIVDEAADYRNSQTKQYEMLEKITKKRRLWMLTGAPCPQAPTDAWALAKLVSPSLVPQYFSQFQREVMQKISTYRWVPQVGAHARAFSVLQPAIRFKKADCISLPPVTYTNRAVKLSADQQKAYDQMKATFVVDAGQHQLTAVNAADKGSKLLQILCGAIKVDDNTYTVIDHKPRFDELTACIQQAAAKVLIIAPFKGITRSLTAGLNDWHTKQHDGLRTMMVNGDITLAERNRIFQDFRDDPTLNELVCHPKVMSHGLTLVEADMLVFYAPIHSNDMTAQVENRINRPGQKRSMTIVRLVANSFEQQIYAKVQNRQLTQQSMLELFKNEIGVA